MKKLSITLSLICIALGVMGQVTIPIKNKAFIDKVTKVGSGVTWYDYHIFPNIPGHQIMAWANLYHGKWYSNYPYTIKFKNNRNVIYLFKNSKLIYVWIVNEKQTIINKGI